MKVNEVAQAGGVTAETVRHYTREGLLPSRRDPRNGYQLYDDEALCRLRFIKCLRMLGFSLREINKILFEAAQGTASCPRTREIFSHRFSPVRSHIQDLQALSQRLDKIMEEGGDKPVAVLTGNKICWLIEELAQVELKDLG